MDPTHIEDVRFHLCSQCRGTFFAAGELARLLSIDISEHLESAVEMEIESIYECRTCQRPMTNRWMDTDHPVHIHQCDECGGIYLEKGELAAMQTAYGTESNSRKSRSWRKRRR
jgi:Zn-finger nucleic acid-binding protein